MNDILTHIKDIEKVEENSYIAKEAFRLIKSTISRPEKTKGQHGEYISLESSIEAINKAIRNSQTSLDFYSSFGADLLSCTLHINFGIKVEKVLHTFSDIHIIALPSSIDKSQVLKHSSSIIQGFGGYTTYMYRYALRSYFSGLFDDCQDPDFINNKSNNNSNNANTVGTVGTVEKAKVKVESPFKTVANEIYTRDRMTLLENLDKRKNKSMTLRDAVSFLPDLLKAYEVGLNRGLQDSSISDQYKNITEDSFMDICKDKGHMLELKLEVNKILKQVVSG